MNIYVCVSKLVCMCGIYDRFVTYLLQCCHRLIKYLHDTLIALATEDGVQLHTISTKIDKCNSAGPICINFWEVWNARVNFHWYLTRFSSSFYQMKSEKKQTCKWDWPLGALLILPHDAWEPQLPVCMHNTKQGVQPNPPLLKKLTTCSFAIPGERLHERVYVGLRCAFHCDPVFIPSVRQGVERPSEVIHQVIVLGRHAMRHATEESFHQLRCSVSLKVQLLKGETRPHIIIFKLLMTEVKKICKFNRTHANDITYIENQLV